MADPNKPGGSDAFNALMKEATAQIAARLKAAAEKKSGKRATSGADASAPAMGDGGDMSSAASKSGAQVSASVPTPHHGLEPDRAEWDIVKIAKNLAIGGVAAYVTLKILGIGKFVSINGTNYSFNGESGIMNGLFGSIVPLAIFIVGIIFVIKAIRVVPQQRALVVERLGRFDRTLEPGLRFTIPFVDRVSARHDLREVPLDVPSQVCITKDNTQLQVDGILYFQVTDPKLATYGSSNYIVAITQLAQTTLRSVIGKLELDKTFEERDTINHAVVNSLDAAASNWGVKVLRYEIKDLTPPKEILHAMQAQITAEREKRALIAASEGRKQEQINIAMGQKEAAIAKSEGEKISNINQAQGEASAILAKAEANAEAIRKIAMAIESQGGLQAVNLKVAEQYVAALGNIAKVGNTIVVPQNMADIASLVTTATSVLKLQKP